MFSNERCKLPQLIKTWKLGISIIPSTGYNVDIDIDVLEMILVVLSCHVYIYYIRCSATTPKCPPANAHYTSDFLLQNYKVYCTFIFLDIMWNKPTKKK